MGSDQTAGDPGRPKLEGELVELRPVREEDVPALLAILAEPQVARWWRRSEWERVDEQGAATFVIVLRDDGAAPPGAAAGAHDPVAAGAVVGCIQYAEELDPDYLSAAVDIFVSAAVQGRGVGPDAMRVLIAWLIDERGHHRLTVDPATANARAIHVYEKLGFRSVGVLRQYERVEGDEWRDALLMELVAGDFVRSQLPGGGTGVDLR